MKKRTNRQSSSNVSLTMVQQMAQTLSLIRQSYQTNLLSLCQKVSKKANFSLFVYFHWRISSSTNFFMKSRTSPVFLSFMKYYITYVLIFFKTQTFWTNKKFVSFFNWEILWKFTIHFFMKIRAEPDNRDLEIISSPASEWQVL